MVDEVGGGQKLLKGIEISLALRLEEAAYQGLVLFLGPGIGASSLLTRVPPRWIEIIHVATWRVPAH